MPRPLHASRVIQGYAEAVDPSFTFNTAAAPRGAGAMPCRVLAAPNLRPLLAIGWEHSATFRQQCRRLAGAGALVLLQRASAKETPWEAESQIGRQASGRVVARVRVRDGRESVEIIAHELEHVLERVDGVQLALDAARAGSGTTLAGGAFETRRATLAGRKVAKEIRRAPR